MNISVFRKVVWIWTAFPRRIVDIWTFVWPVCVARLMNAWCEQNIWWLNEFSICVYVSHLFYVLLSHPSPSTPSLESKCLCYILGRWGQFMEGMRKSFLSFCLCIWVGKCGCIMCIGDAPHAHNLLVLDQVESLLLVANSWFVWSLCLSRWLEARLLCLPFLRTPLVSD